MKIELDSIDSQINLLERAKKPDRETGMRLGKSLYSSGLNAKAKGSKNTFGNEAIFEESQRRECNHFQQNIVQKRVSSLTGRN